MTEKSLKSVPTGPDVRLTPTQVRVANRRRRVAALRAKGLFMSAIAAELGISKMTVSRDLKALRSPWDNYLTTADVLGELGGTNVTPASHLSSDRTVVPMWPTYRGRQR
jgi:hypothetical protein